MGAVSISRIAPDGRHRRTARRLAATVVVIGLAVLGAALASGSCEAEELRERFAAHDPDSGRAIDHSAWDRLLRTYLHRGEDGVNRFDYAGLKAGGHGALKAYLRRLQAVDPAGLSRDEQFAFWVNLYNAKTVDIVTRHYPVKSIRDIRPGGFFVPGPWREKVVTVGGVRLSLDDIEHRILRPIWRDPRIHYAVNCASVGCPNLAARAYEGAAMEEMLEKAARGYINSPRGVRVSRSGVVASRIYDWYADDFGGTEARILDHVRRYAAARLKNGLAGVTDIAGYGYDWTLNDAR